MSQPRITPPKKPPHILIVMDAAIAGLIGVSIGAIPGILTYWLGRRSEERRHLREMIFKAALEEWKLHNDRIRTEAPGHSPMPLDAYLIHAAYLIAEIDKTKRVTTAEVRRMVRESRDVAYAAQQESKAIPKSI